MQLRAILCVSRTVWYPDPTGVHVFNWILRHISWFLESLDLFLIQSKLIYCSAPPIPPSFCTSAQKQTPFPPAGWRDGPQNPRSSAHLVLGVLAELSECNEAALSDQHLLFWVTCQQRGRVRCAAGAWRRDEQGCGRETPCLQGGQAEWESPPQW